MYRPRFMFEWSFIYQADSMFNLISTSKIQRMHRKGMDAKTSRILSYLVSLFLHSGKTGESAKLNLRLSARMGSGTLLLFEFSLGSTDWMALSSDTTHRGGIVTSWDVGFEITTGK